MLSAKQFGDGGDSDKLPEHQIPPIVSQKLLKLLMRFHMKT